MDVRWWILICCSLIGFCNDFFTELPGIVVQRLTGTADACKDQTDNCTYLNVKQFNLLFTASNLASGIGAFCAGLIIDRYGCKYALWGSSILLLFGGALFLGGTYFKDTPSVFTSMIIGNIIAGISMGATAVICHRIKASWFLYKELGVAFSVHIFCGRLGSATSYLLIGAVLPKIGLHPCLWIGFGLALIACGALVTMSFLDERGAAMVNTSPPDISTGVILRFFKSLDSVYICFAVMVPFYYGTVATFTANGPNFLAKAYGYSESAASYIVGLVYDIALFSVLFGWLTDRYGHREAWFLAAAGLLFMAFLLLVITAHFPAWLLTTLVGFGYTIFGPTIWSSVALVVVPAYVGSALGLLKFCHYAGVGVLTAVAGEVLQISPDDPKLRGPWTGFIIQLLVTSVVVLLATGIMTYFNSVTGSRLVPSQRERESKNGLQEFTPLFVDYGAKEADLVAPRARVDARSEDDERMRKISEDLTRILINR
ncbi:uncharacterized protein LOC129586250 [Paramacrobiotus metropolitanus]|uniref:uncharacterized protein LOC129586250 n=1 Tax=Paramacrobiotus metropolitanus TaxID=2943436 RepID=UPI0024456B93|nr:uncharacterized protein LOC129586250 [Paramacrobiotus metropolitanus]